MMDDMRHVLIHGRHTEYTREVPPDFTAHPYSCLEVECPNCGCFVSEFANYCYNCGWKK